MDKDLIDCDEVKEMAYPTNIVVPENKEEEEPKTISVNNYKDDSNSAVMPKRNDNSNDYRYGFGGHEKDDEVSGRGNHLSFGDYGYDPRLGRRWNSDPEDQIGISNYAVFRNNPMNVVDPNGKDPVDPRTGEEISINLRDAQGNVLAVYEKRSYEDGSEELYLTEQHIYGSARLGMRKPDLLLAKSDEDVEIDLTMSSRALGEKRYELTNHLGNVLAVVSDKRLPNDEPDVVSVSDYYPYGMIMPDRNYDAEEYRYGFGGHEKDDEVSGEGNHLSFGDYGYDTRLGRRWDVDPEFAKIPEWSSYIVFGDNPVYFVDSDGKIINNPYDKEKEEEQYLKVETAKNIVEKTNKELYDITSVH